jgi:hypothetical protein
MRWAIFAAVFAAQLLVTSPTFLSTCRRAGDVDVQLLYLGHHALDVFLFWSFLFLTRRVEWIAHIALVVIVALHWFSYGNKCIATVMLNRACAYPEEDWLDSLKNRLGLRMTVGEHFHFVWLGAVVAWEMWKLFAKG